MSWAARWAPALLVALGAAVATAHGLYEVAHASKVPGPIAWLYPLVTDGLAMVAYSATGRLSGRSAGYAWTCVVLAAGLSGLAQAVYLAADTVVAAPVLRFGAGAWPAIACALVAHLLHLIVTADHQNQHGQDDGRGEQDGEADEPGHVAATPALAPGQDPAPVSNPALALTVAAGTTTEPDADADRAADDRAGEQDGQDRAADAGADGEPDDQVDDEQYSGDGRVRLLVALLGAGADVTGPQAAALLSHQAGAPVSDRTARRLLATARESTREISGASDAGQQPFEQPAELPAGRARLVLLPTGTSTTSATSSTSSDSDEGDQR